MIGSFRKPPARNRESSSGESQIRSEIRTRSMKTDKDSAVVVKKDEKGELVDVGQLDGAENLTETSTTTLNPQEIEEKFTELNETINEKVDLVFSKQLEELQDSMDVNGVAGKDQYDSLKESVEAELEKVEELLEANLTDEDKDEMVSRLLEIKETLQAYKVEVAKSLLPKELLGASSVEGVAEALAKMKLGDFEDRDEFVEKLQFFLSESEDLEQLLDESGEDAEISQIKKIANGFKKYGYLAGMGASVFFDAKMGDLGAFISFILNPTGSSSGGYEYRHGEKGQEVIPYYVFKEKFRNHSLVGRSMSEFIKKQGDKLGLSAWSSTNKDNLSSISESSDIVKTHGVLSSFYEVALKDDVVNSEERWDIFKKEFTREMFGDKEVSMDEESTEFLKDLLKNEAEGLKKFWKMDKEDSKEEITEDVSAQMEDTAPEVAIDSSQPEEASPES